MNEDTITQLAEVLKGVKPIDRTSTSFLEDQEFVDAVRATGHKQLSRAEIQQEFEDWQPGKTGELVDILRHRAFVGDSRPTQIKDGLDSEIKQ